MKIPNIRCKIEMFSSINPSEDPQKIQTAITSILPHSNVKISDFSITASSEDLSSLEKIYETIRAKHSERTYRRNLEKNLNDNSTWFYLNKQAAFVGKVAICEQSEESPLGPIKVVLTSSNIDEIVDWFVSRDEY